MSEKMSEKINLEDIQKAFEIWHGMMQKCETIRKEFALIGESIEPPAVIANNEELQFVRAAFVLHSIEQSVFNLKIREANELEQNAERRLLERLEYWGVWYRVKDGYIKKISNQYHTVGVVVYVTDATLLASLRRDSEVQDVC